MTGKEAQAKLQRKSYGLEFIEIRKEIESELKTIDRKYKNSIKHSLDNDIKMNTAILQHSKSLESHHYIKYQNLLKKDKASQHLIVPK